jgi:hypothetical protein
MMMSDLVLALGLMLVIEGCLYALFPDAMKRAVAVVLEQPSSSIRAVGLVAALIGLGIAWLVRG